MQLTFIYLRESFAYVLSPVNLLLFTTMAPSSNQLMHPGYSVEIKTRNQYSETLVRGFGKKKSTNKAYYVGNHLKRTCLNMLLFCNSVLKLTFHLLEYYSIQIPHYIIHFPIKPFITDSDTLLGRKKKLFFLEA